MSKLTTFGIVLAENKQVYFPGEIVAGNLIIKLSAPMEIEAVKIHFFGGANVLWTETSGTGDNKTSTTYSNHEQYYDITAFVYGKGVPGFGNVNQLMQGEHVFPFTFTLPATLPTSFQGSCGSVHYDIESTIVKPSTLEFNHKNKHTITVIGSMFDLNAISNALTPSGSSDSKMLCCGFCSTGPIEVEFYVDRTGYVPGQWIFINATVTNMSNSKIKLTSAQLIQTATFHATSRSRDSSVVVCQILGPECRAHSKVTWSNEKLQIPPLPPSDLNNCRILDIKYFIQFTVHVRSCSINLRPQAPIVIGTVPLRNVPENLIMPSSTSNEPLLVPGGGAFSTQFASTQFNTEGAQPPPSYSALAGETVNVGDRDMTNATGDNFKPQYTYYDWKQTPPN